MARHSLEEHTGELEIHLEAASLGELFSEAAHALAEIMGGPVVPSSLGAAEQVSIESPDRNALLVDWLNELIYLAERDKKIFGGVRIERVSDQRLMASVRGCPVENPRLQVKAATFHGLDIRAGPGGLVANVVLDV